MCCHTRELKKAEGDGGRAVSPLSPHFARGPGSFKLGKTKQTWPVKEAGACEHQACVWLYLVLHESAGLIAHPEDLGLHHRLAGLGQPRLGRLTKQFLPRLQLTDRGTVHF